MDKYTATTPIHHDGELYPTGASIMLDAAHAQALLEIGAITPERKPGKKAEADRKAAEQAEADRAAAEAAAGDPGDSHPT